MKRLLLPVMLLTVAWAALVACTDRTAPRAAWVGCDSTWTVTSGDTTYYQRTVCTTETTIDSAIASVDTVWSYDSATVVFKTIKTDSVTVATTAATFAGLPFGPNAPGDSLWGKYGLTGTYQGMAAKYILPNLRKGLSKGYSFIVVMPRASQTYLNRHPGDTAAWYSVKQTWKAIDSLVRVVPPDSMRKYVKLGVFRGYLIGDDMNCGKCWGSPHGNPWLTVSGAQMDSVYKYARAKLPAEVALGIRVHPSWLVQQKSTGTSRYLDFYWLQYVTRYKDQKTWYDAETAVNRNLPHPGRIAYGLNVYKYDESAGIKITATQLKTAGALSIDYPGNCFASYWRWWDGWRLDGRGAVWDYLAAKAKAKTGVPSCKAP